MWTSSSPDCAPPISHPPSFPTRRSSDLAFRYRDADQHGGDGLGHRPRGEAMPIVAAVLVALDEDCFAARDEEARSEEHTSELQSLTKLVCRLLLEKKNY